MMNEAQAIETESAAPRRGLRRLFGREFFAWAVIGTIALGAVFIQSCPDHANAAQVSAGDTWEATSPWAAIFNCPIHQAFSAPGGEAQGS